MAEKFFDTLKANIEKKPAYAAAVAVAAFLVIALLSLTAPYSLFELKLYDLRFRAKPRLPQWEHLSFLNIDDNSLRVVGQFPWPRYIYADGLKVLQEVGARQVTFDTQFMDSSPRFANKDKLKGLEEKVKKGGRISGEELAAAITDSDKILAEGLKAYGRGVLPFSFLNEELYEGGLDEKAREERQAGIRLFTERASIPVPRGRAAAFQGLVDPERKLIQAPIPELARSARAFGFVDSDFDIDGICRKIRLVRVFKDRIYFHMALSMLMDLAGVKKENVQVEPGSHVLLKGAVNPMTLTRGDIRIPIDEKGMMYINWAGAFERTFNHLSFYALLEYTQVKDEVHGFLDEQEIASGSTARSALYGTLPALYEKYETSTDLAVKRDAWTKIADTRKKIAEIEKGLVKPLLDEQDRLQAELKKNKTPEAQQALEGVQNYLTAVKLVAEVERLRDHAGIIGLTGTASHDIGVTPLSSEYLMVGTYHNIINTVLHSSYIRKTDDLINYALMFLLAVGIGLLIQRLGAAMSLVVIVFSFVALNAVNVSLFAFGNTWLDMLGTSLSLLLPALIIGSVKFLSEESQKRFIKSAFSHYLSPRVIDEIIKNPESLQLGGELREISIFFSDVAGFSTISEKLTPPQLVTLLNEYLSAMTDIILGYNGTVDKYEGDAIIAFFGAPHPYPDHALKLCMAAIDMKKRLAEMREVWRRIGQEELRVRMGMNTGNAVVGNMGSRTRMDYTMMGDSVNLAARLEGANKFYGTYAMISETTHNLVKDDIEARVLDIIRVVGKTEPITVYELLGMKGKLPDYMYEMMEKYNEGVALWKGRDWEGARSAFRSGLKIVKDDGPCKTYLERCNEFIVNPPPRKWDGIYRLKSK